MHIREYLCREATRNKAMSLAGLDDEPKARDRRTRRRSDFLDMMGITHLVTSPKRSPLNAHITGEIERGDYRIQKLYFESLPRLYVTGNLYLPTTTKEPAPGVLYLCGHEPPQKFVFQAHARRLAQLGFVTLIIETIQRGEFGGHHNGPRIYEWFHWYSRGYTAGGVELWNSIRALDFMESLPEVDGSRLGVTGHSGGGAGSWWLAAADDRVKAVAPVCGTYTFESHVRDRTVDINCDCMMPINYYGWEFTDVGALVAPRPLLIASAAQDMYYAIQGARDVYATLKTLYDRHGASDALRWVETKGPHAYQPESCRAVFAWFIKHLQGAQVSEDKLPTIDTRQEVQESEEALRVFTDELPRDQRVTTIHEEFIPLAPPPTIATKAQLTQVRDRVKDQLMRTSFHQFPREPLPLNVTRSYEMESREHVGGRFRFESESGIWINGSWSRLKEAPTRGPVLIHLQSPSDAWNASERWLKELHPDWTRVSIEVRGTGDHSWHPQMNLHVRRAAMLTGRTVASLQVYDALRALEAVKQLFDVDSTGIALAGGGQMAAITLYAALLKGDMEAVVLEDPPATQNTASPTSDSDLTLEMLGCLQITDLPHVAGLLWPTELVFVAGRPESYRWAEDAYIRLGAPGSVCHVARLSQWRQKQSVINGDHLAPRT